MHGERGRGKRRMQREGEREEGEWGVGEESGVGWEGEWEWGRDRREWGRDRREWGRERREWG
jgi:hypothetical protein